MSSISMRPTPNFSWADDDDDEWTLEDCIAQNGAMKAPTIDDLGPLQLPPALDDDDGLAATATCLVSTDGTSEVNDEPAPSTQESAESDDEPAQSAQEAAETYLQAMKRYYGNGSEDWHVEFSIVAGRLHPDIEKEAPPAYPEMSRSADPAKRYEYSASWKKYKLLVGYSETPLLYKGSLLREEVKMVEEEGMLVVEEDTRAVEEEMAAVEDVPAVEEDIPLIEEDVPVIEEVPTPETRPVSTTSSSAPSTTDTSPPLSDDEDEVAKDCTDDDVAIPLESHGPCSYKPLLSISPRDLFGHNKGFAAFVFDCCHAADPAVALDVEAPASLLPGVTEDEGDSVDGGAPASAPWLSNTVTWTAGLVAVAVVGGLFWRRRS
ncbi:hypothetical protein BDV95DRAFT_611808 [Massariosphaeria phaeospora]|uniref:Uncharacterized protein n=1 Tax=Massariosphaeria phaeospora TaxID=100035 RepID=A0A7C8I6G3_9PLEO|nr:hypothetical protein BDV95DRAFT_611808 [Massariosphaeria phaeospora]